MKKERALYNDLVDALRESLNSAKPPYSVIVDFLKNQGIGAESTKHKGLKDLTAKTMNLPFEDDELLPMRRVK